MNVRILMTGGTMDKHYNELNGELIFTRSTVPEMLAQGRARLSVELQTLMLKDSLDMDDDDRRAIVSACAGCEETRVVITHGTDTMIETAASLAAAVAGKTIVLLGAMVPYRFKNSDALFNLGAAVTAAQTLEHGVYITMNGKVFGHDDVTKNREIGEFERR